MIAISLAPARRAAAFLSEISPKDSKWDAQHQRALAVAQLYLSTELSQYGTRMSQCAPLLGFAERVNQDGSTSLKLHSVRLCRCRLCPMCQSRRSLMWSGRSRKGFQNLLQDYPKLRFVFLTLTVPNCPLDELRQTIRHMNEAWRRLTLRASWPALGFIKSIEVTRSKDGLAHPHIHAVLAVPPSYFTHGYLSHAKWVELWQGCLRVDYTPIVNIKAVKPKSGTTREAYVEAVISAAVECVKYSVKDSDFTGSPPKSQLSNAEWLEGLTKQLLNTRAVSVGGILKKYFSEDEEEDLIHGADQEAEATPITDKFTFGWRENVQKYAFVERVTKWVESAPETDNCLDFEDNTE